MQYQKFEGRRPHPSYNPEKSLKFKSLSAAANQRRRSLTLPAVRGLAAGFLAAVLISI